MNSEVIEPMTQGKDVQMVMQAVVTSNNINNHKQIKSPLKTSLFKISYYYKP